jgi:nucleotide-binding universal stress UspA family protein
VAASSEKQQIVVGADGSDNAERALQWAMQEAKLRGATIRIVTAWHVPFAIYPSPGPAPPSTTSLEDEMRQAAEAIAAAAAIEVRDQADLPVETRVVEGHAADVLIDAARDADLLVLGSPAHRGHSPWLTSSASIQCAVHAPVPTAIVH